MEFRLATLMSLLLGTAHAETFRTWTYLRGTTAPEMLVTIVDGRIKSIESGK